MLMSCEENRYKLNAVIVKVLYYWVDDDEKERLHVLIGDRTGILSFI